MFLDIQMPGVSGLDVVAQVPQESMPMVVFVTAFDRFAINAFEAHALDYLLKPVDDDRLARALDRVRAQWQQKQAAAQREQLHGAAGRPDGQGRNRARRAGSGGASGASPRRDATPRCCRSGRVARRCGSTSATIDWIDAAGDYMCLHAAGQTHVLRATMKELEDMLDPAGVPARASLDDREPRARALAAAAPERRMFPEAAVRPGNQAEPQFPGQGRDAARPVGCRAENGLTAQRRLDPAQSRQRAGRRRRTVRLISASPCTASDFPIARRYGRVITLLALLALFVGQSHGRRARVAPCRRGCARACRATTRNSAPTARRWPRCSSVAGGRRARCSCRRNAPSSSVPVVPGVRPGAAAFVTRFDRAPLLVEATRPSRPLSLTRRPQRCMTLPAVQFDCFDEE